MRPVALWLRSMALVALAVAPVTAWGQETSPLTAEETASLEEIRNLVRSTAKRYRMLAPLEVSVASWVGSPSLPQFASSAAVHKGGALYLSRRVLRAPSRDVVIAMALAYEMLRGPGNATSVADRQQELVQKALDADARAVDILIQVKGMSEQAALDQMYAWLFSQHQATLASGQPTPPGRPRPCDAIADLLRRYPGSMESFAGRECAPA